MALIVLWGHYFLYTIIEAIKTINNQYQRTIVRY